MEFSKELLSSLAAASSDKIPAPAFKELVEFTVAVLVGRITEDKISGFANLASLDAILMKQSNAALSSLLLEAAKANADPTAVKDILNESKMEGPRSDFIVKLYGDQKNNIRENLLTTTTIQFPTIFGVDWRLDYFIKSNKMEKSDTPVFYITLKTKKMKNASEDYFENVSFTCTLEQLTELVTNLKDAVKQVERSGAQ